MPKIQVDGKEVEVAQGATVMDAATRLGIYVPHFCWHKKLSIAANCRMCLVEIEKAPKPMPACATPVAEGMTVWTGGCGSARARTRDWCIRHCGAPIPRPSPPACASAA